MWTVTSHGLLCSVLGVLPSGYRREPLQLQVKLLLARRTLNLLGWHPQRNFAFGASVHRNPLGDIK
jgi:hypothetical protein